MITRRCAQRQFLLRPSKEVNQLFLYALAYAAERFSIDVHAFCVLSNHYHLIVTDRGGELPEFLHWLNGTVARALNAYHGRWENFWAPGSYSAVELVEQKDVIEKILYVLVNPVAAGLVSDAAEWPGLRSSPRDIGERLEVERPRFFFRQNGSLPDCVALNITRPGAVRDSDEAFARLVESRLIAKETQVRANLANQQRKFLGKRDVLEQSIYERPKNPEPRRRLNPRVACRDKWNRIEALKKYQEFLKQYRLALRSFCEGLRDALFPRGTYWMRVHFHARCAAAPP